MQPPPVSIQSPNPLPVSCRLHIYPIEEVPKGTIPIINIDYSLELEQEIDGRWIAEVPELPGVMAYGATKNEATANVEALARTVIATRIENAPENNT